MRGEHGTLSTDAVCKPFQPGVITEAVVDGAGCLKKKSSAREGMTGGNVTHQSWDSKLPVVKAEEHDSFRVPTHDAAPSIRSETVKHGGTRVLASGRVGSLRDSSETPIAQTLLVNGGSLTSDAFRKQLEEFLGVLVFTRAQQWIYSAFRVNRERADKFYWFDGSGTRTWYVQC